ncbi:MAG: efflux RND transporter permease subunit [Armatimonadetes bacterium]|nr:efflux RND transporter permease subunit [Armatimonadota bacterium]
MKLGLSGRLASAFIQSKLTPLLIITALLLGLLAVVRTPREEEPQIIVPMADVILEMPGSTAKEVETKISSPVEKWIWEIPGVEYVYSTSSPGRGMIVVRFMVGQDQERAFVRLREKLNSHVTELPSGASQPLIQPRSIDDVPILAFTLHSKELGGYALRQLAVRLENEIKSVPNVSETAVIGGTKPTLKITLDPAKLASYHLDSSQVLGALRSANVQSRLGGITQGNQEIILQAGESYKSVEQVAACVVSASGDHSVRIRDVATVELGPEDPTQLVLFGRGRASHDGQPEAPQEAVTLSIAKRQGVNAMDVVHAAESKLETLKGNLIPSQVEITTTRNYGESSSEKSNELLLHMGIAVISVTILMAIALGFKESLVVLVAIPVTLGLTLLVFYLYGYTLNRITLFALIFSIGILVDDAIVVVENIVRHIRMPENHGQSLIKIAVTAVDEVGNPTILATFAVIAAILPMAMVGGLMGPYMRPIPVGASAAMIFSLLVAFAITPWAAVRILGKNHASKAHSEDEASDDRMTRLYRRIMTPLLQKRRARIMFFSVVGVLLLGSMGLIAIKAVTVKMLPFDNKNEFQIVVDMPMGTPLEETVRVSRELVSAIQNEPEITNTQIYAGTASPYNFNGLVRHYFFRAAPYQADIQVNLANKHERSAQSHDIVKRLRPILAEVAKANGARIKVAEVPPGPPVLQTLVAEVYGPDAETRLKLAEQVKNIFATTEGVADIDWYVDDDQRTMQLVIDEEKAARSGVSIAAAVAALQAATQGAHAGLYHDAESREEIPIRLRMPIEDRNNIANLLEVRVSSNSGSLVPLSELVTNKLVETDKAIYHKNLLPVVYVIGDVTGRQESPVYAILKMNKALKELNNGQGVKVMTASLPSDTTEPSVKWDGEWHITYEVFRDLGAAFAAVLILIYILVVAWFQDFKTPLVIMAPIPLTLVGILPGHAIMGAFFTATSMIGFIAGAGIIVRNSIILVDFIELRRSQGSSLEDAVIDAGAIRFRPMLLTAAAVIVGSFVILFDPIFQGLAIALMAGEIASTLLSRFAVPVLYYMSKSKLA